MKNGIITIVFIIAIIWLSSTVCDHFLKIKRESIELDFLGVGYEVKTIHKDGSTNTFSQGRNMNVDAKNGDTVNIKYYNSEDHLYVYNDSIWHMIK